MLAIVAVTALAVADTAPAVDPLARCSAAIHGGFVDAEAACARPKDPDAIWGNKGLSFACGDALDYARGLARSARGLPAQTVIAMVKGYDERAEICHGVVDPAVARHQASTPWN